MAEKRQQQQVFHLFGQLPTELRLRIWRYTWEPRTVSLFPATPDSFLRRKSRKPLPASAYVNSESRSETLRYYECCFAQINGDFRWFNFHIDTLCLALNDNLLDLNILDPTDLEKVQRLIVPGIFPGIVRADTPCRDTWPEPMTESFESPAVERALRYNYPSLREITLTTSRWAVAEFFDLAEEDNWHFEFWFIQMETLPSSRGWGHMRTTYIGGLKVRHTPLGPKTYRQRYCCRLSVKDFEALEEEILSCLTV
ncbi:hypothetical protein F4859DRAFT_508412 [Xylaria cf. heliscus]|nr:hypothetical protein F4859DRAFT_508412 [Xylaria cf. heliscus]